MELEQAERFVRAAERDHELVVGAYVALLAQQARPHVAFAAMREARADVLAAQQALLLAHEERRLAERRAGERAALERLPIGESGQWLERGEGEARG